MKTYLKLITIILLLFSFPVSTKDESIYELILDFGNDYVFIHEVTDKKWYCLERAKHIQKTERVRAYCLKRK